MAIKEERFYYCIEIQYLGFRFHGWAKQPKVKTVHDMVDKTLSFVFPDQWYKTLGGSRTDAMVSANSFTFELFTHHEIIEDEFLALFNKNLPFDIKALAITKTDADFNIIQSVKKKEYLYLFSYGEKAHPFCAPLMAHVPESLDIEAMQKVAQLFKGEHNFKRYCTKPSAQGQFTRVVDVCEVVPNTVYTANFFPKESYMLRVISSGFMRNQIRLMMGQLFEVGKGTMSIEDIQKTLAEPEGSPFKTIAPASGLILQSVEYCG